MAAGRVSFPAVSLTPAQRALQANSVCVFFLGALRIQWPGRSEWRTVTEYGFVCSFLSG